MEKSKLDLVVEALKSLPSGHTKVVFGVVVTRWSEDVLDSRAFELSTWGCNAVDLWEAADTLLK